MARTRKRIGFKKLKSFDGSELLCKLEILGPTRGGHVDRNGQFDRAAKRRTSKARVLSIKSLSFDVEIVDYVEIRDRKVGYSPTARGFAGRGGSQVKIKYVVGQIVKPKKKFDMTSTQCSSGIHFFWSKRAAINYR